MLGCSCQLLFQKLSGNMCNEAATYFQKFHKFLSSKQQKNCQRIKTFLFQVLYSEYETYVQNLYQLVAIVIPNSVINTRTYSTELILLHLVVTLSSVFLLKVWSYPFSRTFLGIFRANGSFDRAPSLEFTHSRGAYGTAVSASD